MRKLSESIVSAIEQGYEVSFDGGDIMPEVITVRGLMFFDLTKRMASYRVSKIALRNSNLTMDGLLSMAVDQVIAEIKTPQGGALTTPASTVKEKG